VVRISGGGTQAGDRPAPDGEDIARTSASIIRIAGCRSDQVSLEVGTTGLFTRALIETWDGGRFQGELPRVGEQSRRVPQPVPGTHVDLYGRTSNGSSRNRHSNADFVRCPSGFSGRPSSAALHSSVNESRWLQPPASLFLPGSRRRGWPPRLLRKVILRISALFARAFNARRKRPKCFQDELPQRRTQGSRRVRYRVGPRLADEVGLVSNGAVRPLELVKRASGPA